MTLQNWSLPAHVLDFGFPPAYAYAHAYANAYTFVACPFYLLWLSCTPMHMPILMAACPLYRLWLCSPVYGSLLFSVTARDELDHVKLASLTSQLSRSSPSHRRDFATILGLVTALTPPQR